MFALAGDWRLGSDTLLEAEVETSHRSQPNQPGFSLLGNTLPAPPDPRLNLNNQPWSQPTVFDATTGSLRWQQRLGEQWRFTAQAARQKLRTDDRVAFPFGCTDPNPAPNGTYYADRYCPNGNFDLYDYRSENERRRTDALDFALNGKLDAGGTKHDLTVGVLRSKATVTQQPQAFNYAGTGNVQGTRGHAGGSRCTRPDRPTATSARPSSTCATPSPWASAPDLWVGLAPHAAGTPERAHRRHPGDRLPPVVHHAVGRGELRHSPRKRWSTPAGAKGIESEVAPNRPRYINRGQPLPALKSRQVELGLKGTSEAASTGRGGLRHRPARPPPTSARATSPPAAPASATAASATAASRPAAGCCSARGPSTAARSGCARAAKDRRSRRSNGLHPDQRAGAHAEAAGRLRPARAPGPRAAGRRDPRKLAHGAARQQRQHPRLDPLRTWACAT